MYCMCKVMNFCAHTGIRDWFTIWHFAKHCMHASNVAVRSTVQAALSKASYCLIRAWCATCMYTYIIIRVKVEFWYIHVHVHVANSLPIWALHMYQDPTQCISHDCVYWYDVRYSPMTAFFRSVSASFSTTFCFCWDISNFVFSASLQTVQGNFTCEHMTTALHMHMYILYIVHVYSHSDARVAAPAIHVHKRVSQTHALCSEHYNKTIRPWFMWMWYGWPEHVYGR